MSSQALPPRARRRKGGASGASDGIEKFTFAIIGGGIAGVSCAQELSRLNEHDLILLVSAGDLLKEAISAERVTNNLEEVDIIERDFEEFNINFPNIKIVKGNCNRVDKVQQMLYLQDGSVFKYMKIILCTGASAKSLITSHPNVLTIRDVDSVGKLSDHLQSTNGRGVVVGNGGIAMEIVHEVSSCDITWIVKDEYIGNTFFDATASDFLLKASVREIQSLYQEKDESLYTEDLSEETSMNSTTMAPHTKRSRKSISTGSRTGSALGPHLKGLLHAIPTTTDTNDKSSSIEQNSAPTGGSISILLEQEILCIYDVKENQWLNIDTFGKIVQQERRDALLADFLHQKSLYDANATVNAITDMDATDSGALLVITSSGIVLECDFIICAIGVEPVSDFQLGNNILRDTDGALIVNHSMETSIKNIYAAGDCCSLAMDDNLVSVLTDTTQRYHMHWFQMRLWAQARLMGIYAAQCMNEAMHSLVKENTRNDILFEIFTHMTRFFGFKVVLLGRYNAQGLGVTSELVAKQVVVSDDRLRNNAKFDALQRRLQSHRSEEMRCVCCANTPHLAGTLYCTQLPTKQGASKNASGANTAATTILASQEKKEAMDPVSDIDIYVRITPGMEYVKIIAYKHKVVGALLIGETDLEEVFENLILNSTDVEHLGADLLNPEHDLEDYFD